LERTGWKAFFGGGTRDFSFSGGVLGPLNLPLKGKGGFPITGQLFFGAFEEFF